MQISQIKKFLKDNKWILCASLFFIIWKFFLIGIMWDGRSVPPEPDDSYEYIGRIASITNCSNALICPYPGVSLQDQSGFTYISYSLLLGIFGKLFNLQPETTYYLSFFIGSLFLPLVLSVFIQTFTKNKNLTAWTILFLAFYHGTGESHGFFWIVPSFLSTILFFLLFSYINKPSPNSYWKIILLTLLFTFAHPLSEYTVFILPLYAIILSILSKKLQINTLKNAFLITCIVLLATFSRSYYLKNFNQVNSYGINQTAIGIKSAAQAIFLEKTSQKNELQQDYYSITKKQPTSFLEQKIDTLNAVYFKYIFPHWTAIIPFITIFILLILSKNLKLLSLYFSTFFFFIFATLFNEFGFRSAILLWPITFIIYAFGSWYLLEYAYNLHTKKNIIGRVLFSIVILLSCFFLLINASLALVFNDNINKRNNYIIDKDFAIYLKSHLKTNELVALNPILVRVPEGRELYFDKRVTSIGDAPAYITILNTSNDVNIKKETFTSNLIQTIRIATNKLKLTSAIDPPQQTTPSGYQFEKKFGSVDIYKK